MLYEARRATPGTFFYYLERIVKFMSGLDLPTDLSGQYRYSWFIFPKKRPINTVVGSPLDFCKLKNHTPGKEPSRVVVDECHEMYLEALRKLYDQNKALYGDKDKPLVFC